MFGIYIYTVLYIKHLEEEMATHSSTLASRIPMDRGAWWAAVHRVAKGQIRLKQLSTHAYIKQIMNKDLL